MAGETGVFAIFGCHPHFADTLDVAHKLLLDDLLRADNVVGLGEIGLDYSSKNTVSPEIQKRSFRLQLEMAMIRNLPVCLHIREATDDGFEVLEKVRK